MFLKNETGVIYFHFIRITIITDFCMKKIIIYITLFFSACLVNAQILFEQDIVQGGVTAGGFSTGMGLGSGSFSLYFEPGSTIKKAYLFTYRIGYPPSVPIIINSKPNLFDTTNLLIQVNHKAIVASPVHLYYYDYTDSLKASPTSTFDVTIPNQFDLPINWGYWTITLFVVYENPSLSFTNYSIFINDKNYIGNENYLVT